MLQEMIPEAQIYDMHQDIELIEIDFDNIMTALLQVGPIHYDDVGDKQ